MTNPDVEFWWVVNELLEWGWGTTEHHFLANE